MSRDDPDEQRETSSLQLPLFEIGGEVRSGGQAARIPDLTPTSKLSIARYWFRRYLEQSGYPQNTVNSYSYDLNILEGFAGDKPIQQIRNRDVAQYLDASQNKSTRKRRLTSASHFFRFLIAQAQVLDRDPSMSFYPEPVSLKTPKPLFRDEQERLFEAAKRDGPRAEAVIWLLLNLGLTRAELLRLKHRDIDFTDPTHPIIYIYYDQPRHQAKERKLAAGDGFAAVYWRLCQQYGDSGVLFDMLPQSANRLIERVSEAAQVAKPVSPQSLRDTFAVNQAAQGRSELELLQLLGLANDARNRSSVQRYIRLARPPLDPGETDTATGEVPVTPKPITSPVYEGPASQHEAGPDDAGPID